MKGRSNRVAEVADEWVNGSWTVDCMCGVNFDDGEEMVNCDECGVWVHTRCSRYVKGEKSFACDKCKSYRNSRNRAATITATSPIDDSEETEVAQLLVELPTKTIKMNNPYPPRPPPPPPPLRNDNSNNIIMNMNNATTNNNKTYPPYRLWSERPLEERVHVQGIPGGDPSLFHSLPFLFTSQLWKCSGYVPKKFNFRYSEFPCWDKDNQQQKDDDDENALGHGTGAVGAGVLYSLSNAKASKDTSWDAHVSNKDKPIRRDESGPSKDRTAKKKCKPIHRDHDDGSSKRDVLAFKPVVMHPTSGKPVQVHESKAHKVRNSATTEFVSSPSLDKDVIAQAQGMVLAVDKIHGSYCESPTTDLPKSKPLVEDVVIAASEIKSTEIGNLETIMPVASGCCNSKTKSDANLDDHKGVLGSPPADANGQVLSLNHEHENSIFNDAVATGRQTFEQERRDNDKPSEVASGCQFNKNDKVTDNLCNTKLECEGSESSTEKMFSDSTDLAKVVGQSKLGGAIPPPPLNHHKMVSAAKSSSTSSAIVFSRSSLSDKSRSGSSRNPSYVGKRLLSNPNVTAKKDTPSIDSVKDEDKHETKSTMKDHPKTSANSTPKASQPYRTVTSPVLKHYTSVGKDSLRHSVSKVSSIESSSLSSGVNEPAGTLQTEHSTHGHNKSLAAGGQHRGEKVPQSNLQSSSKPTQSSLGHPPASSNSPAGLSDEELALLLHQELNSSPRVPRVPRVRHAGSLPLSSATATSMLVKRTSNSGGKDQHTFSRRKSKDVLKDRCSREQDSEASKVNRVPSSPDDALIQAEGNDESSYSVKKNSEKISTSAANSGLFSVDADEPKSSSIRDSPVKNREDELGSNKGLVSTYRTLPGLIAEIMGTGRRMTYEELCNAVLPHWPNLRKHNGERYAYSSHSQAVLDCLRNRTEWARLVDRGPKTSTSRKKRRIDAEPANTESEDGEGRTLKDGESKNLESNKEEFPKGRRKARKRRGLALQGRGVKDDQKRRKVEVGSEDSGSFSNSSEDSVSSEDDSQGSGMGMAKCEVSASSHDVGTLS